MSVAASTPARSAISASPEISIPVSPFEPWWSRMARRRSRPPPASSRIRSLPKSSWRPATKHQRCSRRWPAPAEMASNRILLVIDNYDSFTYNLVQYLGELGEDVEVRRNNEVTVDEIDSELKPDRIVISPGPGTPDDAGISLDVIKHLGGNARIIRRARTRRNDYAIGFQFGVNF